MAQAMLSVWRAAPRASRPEEAPFPPRLLRPRGSMEKAKAKEGKKGKVKGAKQKEKQMAEQQQQPPRSGGGDGSIVGTGAGKSVSFEGGPPRMPSLEVTNQRAQLAVHRVVEGMTPPLGSVAQALAAESQMCKEVREAARAAGAKLEEAGDETVGAAARKVIGMDTKLTLLKQEMVYTVTSAISGLAAEKFPLA